MTKIRIFQTLKQALQDIWNDRKVWGKVAFWPIVLLIPIEFVISSESLLKNHPLFLFFGFLIALFPAAQVEFKGYTYFLKGAECPWWFIALNGRFWKMFTYMFFYLCAFIIVLACIYGICYGVYLLFGAFPANSTHKADFILLNILAFYGLLTLFGLLSLVVRLACYGVFIVLEKSQPFRSSWRLLGGNSWRFLVLTLVILSVPLFSGVLETGAYGPTLRFLIAITKSMLDVFCSILLVKSSSLVFQALTEGAKHQKTPKRGQNVPQD